MQCLFLFTSFHVASFRLRARFRQFWKKTQYSFHLTPISILYYFDLFMQHFILLLHLFILSAKLLNLGFYFYTLTSINLYAAIRQCFVFPWFSLDELQLAAIMLNEIRMSVEVAIFLAFYFLESVYIKLANKGGKIVVFKIFP